MKKILFALTIQLLSTAYAQPNIGLIIGDAVRIRSEANVKAKEVSKVYNMREVEILEVSEKWDDLGKKEMCSRYKWVKIKWEGDSTGWVYGKYCFKNEASSGLLTKDTQFQFYGTSCQIQIYQNYEYPVGDEEGLTGCNNTLRVYIYDEKTSNYYSINDSFSKKEEGETKMVFYSNDALGEAIDGIKVEGEKIKVNVQIGYQSGGASAVYTIIYKNGVFSVASYTKSEVKLD